MALLRRWTLLLRAVFFLTFVVSVVEDVLDFFKASLNLAEKSIHLEDVAISKDRGGVGSGVADGEPL
jgi:hypothetical protein